MKFISLVLIFSSLAAFAGSDVKETKQKMEERADEAAADMGRASRHATREVKDKSCELVNGKMECAVQKTKHSIQDAGDKMEDAVD